jgi:single-strand DNA-binding protein
MANANVTIVGNVTRDPELRYSNAGLSVARMGVAVNFVRQNRQTGQSEEETSFFDVVAFGQMAENVGASVNKGTRVVVTGRLQQRTYETQQGEKRSSVEIIADEIGPSLRWAKAEVQRNERTEGGSGGSGGGGGGGGFREVPNTDNSTSSSGGGTPAYVTDEEPF